MSTLNVDVLVGELAVKPVAGTTLDVSQLPRLVLQTAVRTVTLVLYVTAEIRVPTPGETYGSAYYQVIGTDSSPLHFETWVVSRWCQADGSFVWKIIRASDCTSHIDAEPILDGWLERWRVETAGGMTFEGWDRVEPRVWADAI